MKLFIYGAGSFGQVLRRHVELCGHEFEGFVDDHAEGPEVLGSYDDVRARLPPAPDRGVIVAIGYSSLDARWQICLRLREDGYALPSLTHPTAWVHPDAQTGEGTMIHQGVSVDTGARIGDLAVVWAGSIISHDAEIGENTFVAPGAIICGMARVGRHSFIGAGAIVPDLGKVPPGSFVKAGTVTPRIPR